MPYDPSQLPDLRGDYETADQKLKRQLDELAGLLGNNFSWKNGLQYDNGRLKANFNNKGLRASYPISDGLLKGSISDIGYGNPQIDLRYLYPLGGGLLDAGISDIGSGDPRYQLRYRKAFK